MKKYTLTEVEKSNLTKRKIMLSQQEYLAHLIEQDMSIYVEMTIKKRLGLSPEDTPEIDIEAGEVRLKDKVYAPTLEETAQIAKGTAK